MDNQNIVQVRIVNFHNFGVVNILLRRLNNVKL